VHVLPHRGDWSNSLERSPRPDRLRDVVCISMWGRSKEDAQTKFRREALAHVDALHNFARYLARTDCDSEDLVQDAYARAFAAAHQFMPGSNLKAWLFRILRNVFIDRYRRQNADPVNGPSQEEPDFQELHDSRPVAFDGNAAASADIEAALLSLSEASRTIILLDLEGLSETEIAAVLGCPLGTVKSRLSRARATLRELLKDYAPTRSAHGL
jgi:RNA polymerase sigma-70 factor, ECF subfamily